VARLLKQKAAQMDPSQIIAVPLAMNAMGNFLILSFLISGLCSLWLQFNITGNPQLATDKILAAALVFTAISFALFSMFVLCGAPLTGLTSLTAMSSVHFVFQVFAPAVVAECVGSSSCSISAIVADCGNMVLNLLGPSTNVVLDIARLYDCAEDSQLEDLQEEKPASHEGGENAQTEQIEKHRDMTFTKRDVAQTHTDDVLRCLTRCSLASCVLGNVVCAVLCILDWGVQVQRWPIPILLGTIAGHFAGSMLCIAVWLLTRLQGLISSKLGKFNDRKTQ
jgi:hypothetical protein